MVSQRGYRKLLSRYKKEDILFIDFEDYRLGEFTGDNIDELFAAFHQLAGQYPRFLFFDEVQQLPDRHRVIRTLHNRRHFKTIFYREILERYNVKARYVLDTLMNDVLETYSGIFSINRFEKQLKRNGIPGSKRTISNYLHYLEEAFFVIVNEKFSYSPRRRIMNPKKVYLSDSGFAAMGRPFAENRGRILENVVATDLFRRETELFYFKNKNECDFIVKQGHRPVYAIQVCWELNERNEKREFKGLLEACRDLDLNTGLILTYAQEEERKANGLTASVLPVWKWLLISDIPDVSHNRRT